MCKILHTADWHISSDRKDEKVRTIEYMIDYANREGVKFGIIAGDLYDKQPLASDILTVIKLLQKADFSWIILEGNHDPNNHLHVFPQIRNTNVVVLNEITNIPFDAGGLNVFAFPHLNKNNIRKQWPEMSIKDSNNAFASASNVIFQNWKQQIQNDPLNKPSIVLGHFSLDHEDLLVGKTITLNSKKLDEIGCPVLLGHIHQAQEIGDNIAYSGNPCRIKFDEKEEKGFYIWDSNNEWMCPSSIMEQYVEPAQWTKKFISTHARELITITGEFVPPYQWIYTPVDVDGKEVKFKYSIHKKDITALTPEVFLTLENELGNFVNIKYERIVINSENIRSEDIIEAKTLMAKIELYQSINGVPGRNTEILAKLEYLEKKNEENNKGLDKNEN